MISVMDILSKDPILYDNIRNSVEVDTKTENNNKVENGDIVFVRSSEVRNEVGWAKAYLENEFAATKQSAVLETVQQTERQPVQAETMAQAGTGAAKAKAQTAGSESAKERNELFADPEKEARISKVREGIRQTAAAESRFAGMLTPEEEKLMREIISEYV